MNSKCNGSSINPQTTYISNISHSTVTFAEQNPDNSNLDFNVLRDIAPSVQLHWLHLKQARKKSVKAIIAIQSK